VVAAVRAIERALLTMSLDFNDLAEKIVKSEILTSTSRAVSPAYTPTWEEEDEGVHLGHMIDVCVNNIGRLRDREREFIRSIEKQYRRKHWLSVKQRDWLESIYAKLD